MSSQTVKSCGKAHPWCSVCKPETMLLQMRPKPTRLGQKPCRKCGTCDDCLGITAPEGFKHCRSCGMDRPVAVFYRRPDTGGYRNHCNTCRNVGITSRRCETCQKPFTQAPNGTYTRCRRHRHIEARECRACGNSFMPRFGTAYYCSTACRQSVVQGQRAAVWAANRRLVLEAYSGSSPACVCCQEMQILFLSLDHLEGGGRQQRAKLGGGGFYTWLRRNNYPPGFQVLCHNCNLGRQLNGGLCPHKAK